mmetsp:Transcript_49812/g.117144  ORF Transcript_49812/g.117144 Transcript_49812/m.117144 type:complete len:131 (+) Transcript_49812:57-449(+)
MATAERLLADAEAADAAAFTIEEVEKHNNRTDAWIVLNGEALDVTNWIPLHPGGEQTISAFLGKDASTEWNMIHQPGTVERHGRFVKKLGRVASVDPPAALPGAGGYGSGARGFFLLSCCRRRKDATSQI